MKFVNPAEILKKIRIKEDIVAADFGSGSGGWVIPLALIAPQGKVYALDILKEPLSSLKAKLKLNKISNVEIIVADVEKETNLINKSCDLVLMTNLLFQATNLEKIFQEAIRVLKNKGRVLVVDWRKESKIGPEKKISAEEIIKKAKKVGLKLKKQFNASDYHYAIIFNK